jgi:hypothetical protein
MMGMERRIGRERATFLTTFADGDGVFVIRVRLVDASVACAAGAASD